MISLNIKNNFNIYEKYPWIDNKYIPFSTKFSEFKDEESNMYYFLKNVTKSVEIYRSDGYSCTINIFKYPINGAHLENELILKFKDIMIETIGDYIDFKKYEGNFLDEITFSKIKTDFLNTEKTIEQVTGRNILGELRFRMGFFIF